MSENPGGTPPPDDEHEPDPAAAETGSGEPTPPPPPAAPPYGAPAYGSPAYGTPPTPAYGAPPEPPAGYVPPAPGAYPPPAQGGYPPPPPPGGGYPPPPPPGGGYPPAGQYGAPPAGYPAAPPPGGGYPAVPPSPLGNAFRYGWNAFTRNGGVFVGAALIWFVIASAVVLLVILPFGGFTEAFGRRDDGTIRIGFSLTLLLLTGIFALLFSLVEAAFVRASLKVTYGQRPGLGDFFRFENAANVVLTALLVAAINLAVGLVSWIPLIGTLIALAVNLLLMFTLWFVVDKRLGPVDAIQSSIALVRANLSTTILFYLLAAVTLGVGAILCGVGLLVAAPVVLVGATYLYRDLLGEPVAPIQ